MWTTRYRSPLREPFVTALRRVTEATGVLAVVRDSDGRTGIGGAAPAPPITGESLESIESAIAGPLRAAVVSTRVDEIDGVLARMSRSVVGNSSAKAALDIALHDLWARSLGAPLHRLLGGARSELVTDVTVSLASPDEMAGAAARRVQEGFSRLKVKLRGSAPDELGRLRAVRASVGPDICIRVDANQGWSVKQAIALIHGFEDTGLDVELVEQPVRASDLDGLARVTASVATPVMADESCFSPEDALELVRRRAADAINVKLMKCGGIRPALALLGIAGAAGVECSVGSMMEGEVSATAAACLAAARSEVASVDLDAPWWLAARAVEGGAVWDGERILLGDEPGLGLCLPPDPRETGARASA